MPEFYLIFALIFFSRILEGHVPYLPRLLVSYCVYVFLQSFIRDVTTSFYCAMHFSAKRGLAIACRPSVRPSVTLVDCDHIGWKSCKLIAHTISQHLRSL